MDNREKQMMAATQKRMLADDMEREAKKLRREAEEIEQSIGPVRAKPARRDDWHYDSQGYCDNPGRGY